MKDRNSVCGLKPVSSLALCDFSSDVLHLLSLPLMVTVKDPGRGLSSDPGNPWLLKVSWGVYWHEAKSRLQQNFFDKFQMILPIFAVQRLLPPHSPLLFSHGISQSTFYSICVCPCCRLSSPKLSPCPFLWDWRDAGDRCYGKREQRWFISPEWLVKKWNSCPQRLWEMQR